MALLLGQAAEPPAWLRSAPDFYGAIAGGDLSVSLTASAAEVARDADFILTLIVSNVRNPRHITRPPLAKLPVFADRFQITDGPPVEPTASEVRFVYVLRAKTVGAVEVPGLKFAYFNPARPDGKLPTKISDPIPLTVRPPVPPPPAVDPLPANERLFAVPPDDGPPFAPSLAWWAAVPVLAGGLALAWAAGWRRRYPDGARLARLRRVRAVRRVLDRLADADRSPDPPAAAAAAVRDYLIERYGVRVLGPVPAEVEAAMRDARLPDDRVSAAGDFFRRCDAARFDGDIVRPSPSASEVSGEDLAGARARTDAPEPLPAVARRLVLGWEDAA